MDTEHDHTLWFSVHRRQDYNYEHDQEDTINIVDNETLNQYKGALLLLFGFIVVIGSYYILSHAV